MSDAWTELRELAATLPRDVAERVASEWARDAQFEHASIASFGRFALELLALGAPSELIESAHRAAIDEIEHARLCFSLASVYGARALGPGPLPLSSEAFRVPTPAALVHATVLEGCVNETLAALEARAAHALAQPEAVRAALLAIERQESDHASLAFRTVSWAIAVFGPDVRAAARAAFARASHDVSAHPSTDLLDDACARQGRLPARDRAELRRRALHEVLAPAMRSLLD
jgi:hypothetical protein